MKIIYKFFYILLILLTGCFATQIKTIRINSLATTDVSYYTPLKNPKILSKFGPRGKSFHTGIDLRGKEGKGEKVLASRAGRVIRIRKMKGYGKVVELRHPDGYRTRYAHLKKQLVKLHQTVKAKDPIGLVGETGRTNGPHLHFEIITPKNQFVDPARFLKSL